MPTTTLPVRELIVSGTDSYLIFSTYNEYPVWAMISMTAGFVFCMLSCIVWFVCAIIKMRQEKPCNHAVYSTHIVTDENGEQGLKSEVAKHSKKVEALSEAESLAKSFKSVRSKKSTKSNKSVKSSKVSAKSPSKKSASRKSSKSGKKSSKSAEPAQQPEEKPDGALSPARNEGGGDYVIKMEDGGERKTGFFKRLISKVL